MQKYEKYCKINVEVIIIHFQSNIIGLHTILYYNWTILITINK